MRVAPLFLLSLAGLLAACAAAHAGAPYPPVTDTAPFAQMLTTCKADWDDAPDLGAIASVVQLGVQDGQPIFHAHMAKRAKQVIFVGTRATADPCPVFPIGRAAAGAYGDFLGDGRRLRAFVVMENAGLCASKACTAAVVVRDDKKNFLAVGWTEQVCDAPEAKRVRIFDDRDSLELRCHTSIGVDTRHAVLLFHATGRAFAPILVAQLGVATNEGEPDDEGNVELCTTPPSGFMRVVKRGAAPVIEVFEPGDEAGDVPTGNLVSYGYDAKLARFVAGNGQSHRLAAWPDPRCEPLEVE